MIYYSGKAKVEDRGWIGVRLVQSSFGWRCLRAGRSRRPAPLEWCSDPAEAVADYFGLFAWPEVVDLAPLPSGTPVILPGLPRRLKARHLPPGSSQAARRLRELMDRDPRDVIELAALAGMPSTQWSHYRHGRRTPGLDLAERILLALGLSMRDLADPVKPVIVLPSNDPHRS